GTARDLLQHPFIKKYCVSSTARPSTHEELKEAIEVANGKRKANVLSNLLKYIPFFRKPQPTKGGGVIVRKKRMLGRGELRSSSRLRDLKLGGADSRDGGGAGEKKGQQEEGQGGSKGGGARREEEEHHQDHQVPSCLHTPGNPSPYHPQKSHSYDPS
ncbi:ste kinase, partial [Cystoisospora suis]